MGNCVLKIMQKSLIKIFLNNGVDIMYNDILVLSNAHNITFHNNLHTFVVQNGLNSINIKNIGSDLLIEFIYEHVGRAGKKIITNPLQGVPVV